MLLDFVRWLQGFVQFLIIGKFPERFINIVTKNHLSIWNTQKKDGILRARMYVRDYKNIRGLARKSRVRLKIESKHGLPFYVRKYKSRVGVLVGVAVFSLVVYIMSCFVWTIDVVGLETVSHSYLMDTLKENGLYIGTFKPAVSFNIIGRNTMLDIEDIGWMSINVLGSHASVEIKEKAKSPKVEDYHTPANVKASRDGLILSVNTAQGEAYFEAGSAVVKDQLLVSGVVEDKLGGVSLVRAKAQVIAQTTRKKTFSVSKDYAVTALADKNTRRTLDLLTLKIPFTFAFADESRCAVRYSTNSVCLFDTTLPVSVNSQRLYEKSYENIKLEKEKAQSILMTKASLYESFSLCDCLVTDKEYTLREDDSSYFLDVTYTCEEDIAYQQDIDDAKIKIERVLPTEKEKTQ